MKEYYELLSNLHEISKIGFIQTHRKGNTGVGKTLEDLLGIAENNIPGPNGVMIELKSSREISKSMITLFTRVPSPTNINSVLLERFGYKSSKGNNKKELHTTVNAKNFNTLKGKTGFKLHIEKNQVNVITSKKEIICYWDKDTLKETFERKLPKVLYVKAETQGSGSNESFWYNKAWLLSGFSFLNFVTQLKEGVILVDIRIGQFPNGRTHDHGTSFRVKLNKLDMCFKNRKRVL